MELRFANPALLDEDLGAAADTRLETFWKLVGRDVAKRAYILNGITTSVPFIVRDGIDPRDGPANLVLRKLAESVDGRTTMSTYGRHAFNLLRALDEAGLDLVDVGPEFLSTYKRRRALTGLQPASWNSEAAALRSFFDAAILAGVRAENPTRNPTLRWVNKGASVTPEDPKFVTLADFERFRDHGLAVARSGTRNVAFASVALTSGMRPNETNRMLVTALPDVAAVRSLKGNTFPYLVPAEDAKGGRSRKVWISKRAFIPLRDYLDHERRRTIQRFHSADGNIAPDQIWLNQSGKSMPTPTWTKVFTTASELSGVKVTPHTLRHTFAVYLLSSLLRRSMISATSAQDEANRLSGSSMANIVQSVFGDPLRQVQRALGHKRYETTFVYLEVLGHGDRVMDEALAIFDAIFGGEEGYADVHF